MTAPIGAHASALMALRAKSLQAYGIDPKMLINLEEHKFLPMVQSTTRELALSKKEERAIAILHDHELLVI